MFEYAKGRFVNPTKIIAANAYQKGDVWRVAIELDVQKSETNTIYSDPFPIYEGAVAFISNLPC